MKILSDYSLTELINELAGFPKVRAKQVFDAIIQAKDYQDTNLPKDMVEKLKSEYILKPIEILCDIVGESYDRKKCNNCYGNL